MRKTKPQATRNSYRTFQLGRTFQPLLFALLPQSAVASLAAALIVDKGSAQRSRLRRKRLIHSGHNPRLGLSTVGTERMPRRVDSNTDQNPRHLPLALNQGEEVWEVPADGAFSRLLRSLIVRQGG